MVNLSTNLFPPHPLFIAHAANLLSMHFFAPHFPFLPSPIHPPTSACQLWVGVFLIRTLEEAQNHAPGARTGLRLAAALISDGSPPGSIFLLRSLSRALTASHRAWFSSPLSPSFLLYSLHTLCIFSLHFFSSLSCFALIHSPTHICLPVVGGWLSL